eukprot:CAMPEP_0172425382 /NCGR_PEP_ID=MMETSP1064-20121228/31730_1 /TAXON_ID=202472 /ORGANISM="Aulacoseira subarctica , Strain CCAP 1002/5" /LENGTH=370 /DNA_ID=CAMNT_0013168193 /DNA_START=98 /DNA_END=1210 /DNA_ORIENTATION=-
MVASVMCIEAKPECFVPFSKMCKYAPFIPRIGMKETTYSTIFSSQYNDNNWSSDEIDELGQDWKESLRLRENANWSLFETSDSNDDEVKTAENTVLDESDLWLDKLQSISFEELEFNRMENERAASVRQMQEWGFSSQVIKNSLGVAIDDKLELEDTDNRLMEDFRAVSFGMITAGMDVDLKEVESHTMVESEEGEPIRSQMVYVDEHTCIGCKNCAVTAPSTFFMEDYLGRARVFQQWGDDDETIKIAIETCPVDCIHYVPYEELVSLEIQRRDQNINFKARLVNQGEYGGGDGHRVGGSSMQFTSAPKISGNTGTRCNNCPSRGCANCPMYGIGKNPEFKRKEEERKRRSEEKRRRQAQESANKRAEL